MSSSSWPVATAKFIKRNRTKNNRWLQSDYDFMQVTLVLHKIKRCKKIKEINAVVNRIILYTLFGETLHIPSFTASTKLHYGLQFGYNITIILSVSWGFSRTRDPHSKYRIQTHLEQHNLRFLLFQWNLFDFQKHYQPSLVELLPVQSQKHIAWLEITMNNLRITDIMKKSGEQATSMVMPLNKQYPWTRTVKL